MEIKDEILQAIKDVPLLPPSVSELLAVTSDADFALADMVKIIKHDAVMTARLLRVVNSAAYNLAVEVDTVDRAVSMLGSRVIVGIALGNSADGLFSQPLDGYENNGEGVWRHDLYCAIAGRNVAMKAKVAFKPDLAFTGGLLHDIGKTVISGFLQGTASEMLRAIDEGEAGDFLQEEKHLTGLDHAEIGFELAKCWQLPEVLQNAIRYHHKPSEAPASDRALCYAVHIGDTLTMMAGYGTGSDSMQYAIEPGYTEYFDLSEDDLAMIMLESSEEFRELEAVMEGVMET